MESNKRISEIAQLGASVLRCKAHAVSDVKSERIDEIVQTMHNTLAHTNGVGIAAPQIFESERIVIVASRPSKRYPFAPEMEPVVMFNPEFECISSEVMKDWEGCLSIPGIRALVPRYEKIRITYSNQHEEQLELLADSFVARIFQHEYDHLNGLVYLDRVENNRDIISEVEFQKLMEQVI